jgi:uncharacterized protein (TIGR00288 family)
LTPWWLRPTAESSNEPEPRKEHRPAAEAPAESFPEATPSIPEPAALTAPAAPALQAPQWVPAEPELELPSAEDDEEESPLLPFGDLPLDAEASADEAETEGETEEGKEEPRKRRPRRSRGGRRKSGRAALGTADEGPEEDDDEAVAEEPAAPAVAAIAAAPVPVAAPPVREPREPREPRRGRSEETTATPASRERWAKGDEAPAREAREPRDRWVRSGEPVFAPPAARTRSNESYVIPAAELGDHLGREIVISLPERTRGGHDERKIAMFCDLENIALGVRDSDISKFDIGLILERLLEKGKIIVKKAYADWERYSDYKRTFHEAAIELIDIPQKYYSGKNSADIKMVVDAMDLSYSKEHLDTFVLLSGDSDFSPLVSKLKENNKYVIGIGVKNSSSALLIDNCDEFIYYEDVWRDSRQGPKLDGLNKKTAEAFGLMVESIQALARENKDVLWGSMIKQTMQRKKPSFNEGYYGYSTFSELLEDAERKSIIKLKKDQRSGTYVVTGFAKDNEGRRTG